MVFLISQQDYVLQPCEVAVGNREASGRARTLRGTSYPGSNGQTKKPKGVASGVIGSGETSEVRRRSVQGAQSVSAVGLTGVSPGETG